MVIVEMLTDVLCQEPENSIRCVSVPAFAPGPIAVPVMIFGFVAVLTICAVICPVLANPEPTDKSMNVAEVVAVSKPKFNALRLE